MSTEPPSLPELDIREKLARIDQMLADRDRKRQEMDTEELRRQRLRQEIGLAPWAVALSGVTAGAALFAAAVAFVKLVLP